MYALPRRTDTKTINYYNRNFHFEAKADSMCEYCNETSDRQYHPFQCTVKNISLREAEKNSRNNIFVLP